MMKVLTVSHAMPFYGGAEIVIARLCQYMAAHGIENTLVAPTAPPEMLRELEGTRVIIIGNGDTVGRYYRLREKVQELLPSVDVVNVHNFPASLTLPPVHKPAVWMCNEPPELFGSRFNMGRGLLLRLGRYVTRHYITEAVVADEVNAERFQKYYGFEPKVIPYGVDYDFWAAGERNTRQREFMVLQVGTVTRLKNQMATVQAAERLLNTVPNLAIYFVGWHKVEPGYTEKIRAYVNNSELRGRIWFMGPMDRQALRAMYKRANVVVHPIKSQGGWLTPFEALASGTPVVVSGEATCARLISDKGLGYVAHSQEELVCHLQKVYRYQENVQKLTERAKEWVRTNLTWDNFCQAYIGLMEEAIRNSLIIGNTKRKEVKHV